MKKLRKVMNLLKVNWKTLAGFEILYKILSFTVFTPLFLGCFHGIMKATGYNYLTLENIGSFLLNPVTVAGLLLLLVCMAVYTMVDISAVIFLLDLSWQGKQTNLIRTLRYAVKNGMQVFRRENIMIVFVVLFLIPFLNLGVTSGYVTSLKVPEFILDFIASYSYLLLLFLIVLAGLELLLLKWLYAFHYFTLEGCNFREARKRSRHLSKNHRGRDLLTLLGCQTVLALLYFLFLLAGVFLAVILGGLFTGLKWFSVVSSSVVWVFLAVAVVIMSALGTPVSYACISVLFYGRKEAVGEQVVHVQAEPVPENKRKRRILHGVEILLFLLSVAGFSFYLYGISNHKIELRTEHAGIMEVTAHRGASSFYPENTMAAFEGAARLGADWIELDVQQSGDGQIIVLHDTSFKRTTGVAGNTWELAYEEIEKLDNGSFFDSRFAGEKIPLLAEVISFAKEHDIKLNIELKPTGHETDFEKNVVDLIEGADFADSCVITSQVYEVLERVKAYRENIRTVYVMSFVYGDINQLEAADHFSIEATSVTEKMVSDVHNAGKELYAWTVNTEENIDRMIELHVDNIITDNVTLAKERIFLSRTGNLWEKYVKFLQEL